MKKQLTLSFTSQYPEQMAALEYFIAHACAFTGHRPNKLPWGYDETDPDCVALKETLASQIDALIDAGYTDFLSGMALGVDTWGAQMVLARRESNPALKLHCILPSAEQSAKWTEEAQVLYRSILEQADSVVHVRRKYEKDCSLERDRFLVSYASQVLAVYNGEQRGGTAYTVRYARKLGRAIIIIDPLTREITCEAVALKD